MPLTSVRLNAAALADLLEALRLQGAHSLRVALLAQVKGERPAALLGVSELQLRLLAALAGGRELPRAAQALSLSPRAARRELADALLHTGASDPAQAAFVLDLLAPAPGALTHAQLRVLRVLDQSPDVHAAASQLRCSPENVRLHLRNIRERLGLSSGALGELLDAVHERGAFTTPPPAAPALSPRQHEVLRAVGDGLSTEQVAQRLGIGSETVRQHLKTSARRFGMSSRGALALAAARAGAPAGGQPGESITLDVGVLRRLLGAHGRAELSLELSDAQRTMLASALLHGAPALGARAEKLAGRLLRAGHAADGDTRALKAARVTLSPQQRRVLNLAAQGLTNPAIASELSVGSETVKTHMKALLHKLGASNRNELLIRAAQAGELAPLRSSGQARRARLGIGVALADAYPELLAALAPEHNPGVELDHLTVGEKGFNVTLRCPGCGALRAALPNNLVRDLHIHGNLLCTRCRDGARPAARHPEVPLAAA